VNGAENDSLGAVARPFSAPIVIPLGAPSAFAAERKGDSTADLGHPRVAQVGQAAPDAVLSNRDKIVKINGTRLLHTILDTEDDFGWHSPDGGSDRSHCHTR